MEHQGHNVFKKPEEPLQKTPTPYEEACERPAKVRTASAKNPPKMMAVLKETERSLVALHDARSSPDVFWWEGDILVPASYNISVRVSDGRRHVLPSQLHANRHASQTRGLGKI